MLLAGDVMKTERMFSFQTAVDTAEGKSDNHYHNNYEIYYLTQGRCRYFIDKHSYLISAGDIALIPPGVIHKTGYETPTHSRKLINCGEWYIPESVRDKVGALPCFSGSPAAQKQIERIFAAIEREEPDEFFADSMRALVSQLMLLIARESRSVEQRKSESPIVEKAVAEIRRQYSKAVTLEAVAAACFVSKEHLSRTFKKETGFGFSEYLNLYRLKRADMLLRERRDMRVVDVAMQCGFNDSNYFSKVYKKMFGVSPKQAQKEKNDV